MPPMNRRDICQIFYQSLFLTNMKNYQNNAHIATVFTPKGAIFCIWIPKNVRLIHCHVTLVTDIKSTNEVMVIAENE